MLLRCWEHDGVGWRFCGGAGEVSGGGARRGREGVEEAGIINY